MFLFIFTYSVYLLIIYYWLKFPLACCNFLQCRIVGPDNILHLWYLHDFKLFCSILLLCFIGYYNCYFYLQATQVKPPVKVVAKPADSSDDDSDSEEKPQKPQMKLGVAAAAKKPALPLKKKADSSSDDSSSEEAPAKGMAVLFLDKRSV